MNIPAKFTLIWFIGDDLNVNVYDWTMDTM